MTARYFIKKEIVESPRDCPFCSIYLTSDGIIRGATCGYNIDPEPCTGSATDFPKNCKLLKVEEK